MSPAQTNAAITLTSEVEIVVGALSELLDRETDTIREADFQGFSDLQTDKIALLSRYRNLIETLQKQTGDFAHASDAIKQRLKICETRLRQSTSTNKVALEGGISSMTRIMNRVVNAARETINKNRTTYTKSGKTSGGGTLSISVNEVL